jgi:hypothetical protein
LILSRVDRFESVTTDDVEEKRSFALLTIPGLHLNISLNTFKLIMHQHQIIKDKVFGLKSSTGGLTEMCCPHRRQRGRWPVEVGTA